MCPEVYAMFAELLASTGETWGEADQVLEVGAMNSGDTLLTLAAISDTYRLGVNCDRAQRVVYREDGVRVFAPVDFEPDRFKVILCNSVIEHDPRFWETLDDMHKALKPGGYLAVGAPSFGSRLDISKTQTVTMTRHDCPADYYRFSEAMFREVVFAGFEDVTIHDIMDPPRLVGIGRKPL